MFKPVDPKVNIQKLEEEQLDFWRVNRVFQRTMEDREDAPRYVFYEGPPTANGLPGSHHVMARAFKDMFPRYKVMNGYYCHRIGGWDTHGLPVEIAVQKQHDLTSKEDVEAFGIAKFNDLCRANVFQNIAEWEKLTDRIAYWVDLDNAYVTFTNDYIESVWWALKQLWEKGLLYRGYKVVPYSPTSGTPLSSHEVSQGYKVVKDPSVHVRFPVRNQPNTYFLAWTTTPWTLPSNAALAVGENLDYVLVEGLAADGETRERLYLAKDLMESVLKDPESYEVVQYYKGRDLVDLRYDPLYTFLPVEEDHAYVIAADFVSTSDGTGIVHIAPCYGVDDMEMGRKHGLPLIQAVAHDGKFVDGVTPFRGMWFKDADVEIIKDLKYRGLMYKSGKYEHTYPHNWRDGTPLMYIARETWFVRTTEYKDRIVDLNQTINWVPTHIRDGRFGNWLDDLKEWALGRERYWGTPLPVWVDDETGDMLCIGSVAELSELVGQDLTELDLHRPYVDDITFPNPNGSGGTMRRVLEVIDVWFDSGAMPVAQWGYPHRNQDKFKDYFPADYICEAIDQTRGWFYSLHAIASLVFDDVAYKNVICLGHILDDKGQKMSKSKGNMVDPWQVIEQHGADAFRWYMYAAAPPGEPRRFSVDLVGEVVKKFSLTLWNTYSFFVTYANIDGWSPDQKAPPVATRDLLDRWVLSELHQTVERVTKAFEEYDATNATRPVQQFVEQLSNWYVRLSRRRFWKSESDADKLAAYATLYECLVTVAHLIAPSMPFMSDALYRNLVASQDSNAVESVHLSSWIGANKRKIDPTLSHEMSVVQRLVSLGLAARMNGKTRVRQPLANVAFVVPDANENDIVERYRDLIMEELNVKSVELIEGTSELLVFSLNPLPAVLGKKFGKDFPVVQRTLRGADSDDVTQWATTLLAGNPITIEVDGNSYEVTPEECEVVRNAPDGYAVAEERGYLALLDVTLTEDLLNEGLAREVIRRVQSVRRDADFDIDDTISINYQATEHLQTAIQQFSDYIKAETLAKTLQAETPPESYFTQEFSFKGEFEGETLTVGVKRLTE